MTRFQKLLKIEREACKHSFRNMDLKSRTEAIDHYHGEGVMKRQIKEMKKSCYRSNVKECGPGRSKYAGSK